MNEWRGRNVFCKEMNTRFHFGFMRRHDDGASGEVLGCIVTQEEFIE